MTDSHDVSQALRPWRRSLFFAPLTAALTLGVASHAGLCQGLPTAQPAATGLSSAALERIAPSLQQYVDSGKLAGMIMIIARHGKVGYSRAIGRMDVENNTPMRMDAVFRLYSLTKPIIAVAIMKLAEQGRLRLEDPLEKFIPSFASTQVYAGGPATSPSLRPRSRSITIEQLLSHTSGLTYGYFGETPVDSIYRSAGLLNYSRTLEQLADSIARLPLAYEPGDGWAYSFAIDVLGRVVEVASGQPLDVFLQREVFGPLQMTETSFHVKPGMEGRIPVLYSKGPTGALRPATQLLAVQYRSTSKLLSGGGGLLSTPADYLRFAQMLLNGGELNGQRVLSRASVANMMRNHVSATHTPITSPLIGQEGYGYGLGGAVLVDSARTGLPGPAGIYRWWGLMGTFFWVDPKTDLVAMIWTQFNTGRVYPIEQDFQRLVYAAVSR